MGWKRLVVALGATLTFGYHPSVAAGGTRSCSGRLTRVSGAEWRIDDCRVAFGQTATFCGSSVLLRSVAGSLNGVSLDATSLTDTDPLVIDDACPRGDVVPGSQEYLRGLLLVEQTGGGGRCRLLLGLPHTVAVDRRSNLVLVLPHAISKTQRVVASLEAGAGKPAGALWTITPGTSQRDFLLLGPASEDRSPLSIKLSSQVSEPKETENRALGCQTSEPKETESRILRIESDTYGFRIDVSDSVAFVRSQLSARYAAAPGLTATLNYHWRPESWTRSLNFLPAVGVTVHLLDFDPGTSVEFGFALTVGLGRGALVFGWGRNISLDVAHNGYFFVGTSLQRIVEGIIRLKGRQTQLQ